MKKTTFALYFGNRGFFPEQLIAAARAELSARIGALGYETRMMAADATRFGAIETPQEGRLFARFLAENKSAVDGVIICLPNFGDERGAVEAVRDAGVPVMVMAYPDSLDKMDFQSRRDAFCGKLSVMDMLRQYRIPYTAFESHVVHPSSDEFAREIHIFAGVCRVVNGMRRMTVGAVGARVSAFKTVRWDEVTLQKYGITTESIDLSEVFQRMRSVDTASEAYRTRFTRVSGYADLSAVPAAKVEQFTRLSVALDDIIAEYSLDSVALRCWLEMQKEIGIAPCMIIGEMNDRGIPTACETDVGNAVAMRSLTLASGLPSTCLDWNNNYGDEKNKCILFHCGPVPASLMTGIGVVVDHPMFAKSLGAGNGFGPNTGRIKPMPMTFASTKTEDGVLSYYLGEGRFTDDPIAKEFFGCGGVAEINGLPRALFHIGKEGYRHHVSVTPSHSAEAVREAFSTYLNYTRTDLCRS
ncbi:MAG: hypothetical protein HZC28_18430 [Spirochaetes bacterium]|nr:hypothetical protein [Spirochaetota bacterium]